ncbi:MAG TPA: hypothetical protein VKO85_09530 [Wenzhouxiangellaceae bacterium]|nr:hypothetical protein [Wenzhouxiangellaceae bacterium]
MKFFNSQNLPRITPKCFARAAAALAIAIGTMHVQALEVTGSFTGFWGQPDQQNQGLIIAVSRLPNGEKTGVVYWAHYDDMGNPSWLFAQGDIDDDTIKADVFRFEGITFMQPVDENANFGEVIGTLDVQFENCVEGNVEFNTDDPVTGTGEFRIMRLSNQPGSECSGGISDDMAPGDLPQRFDIDLVPTDVLPEATGSAEFDLTPGRVDFEVEIENLPGGEYELQVGAETRGLITVLDTGTGSGEIEFRSPVTPGKELLDFDPRDQIIDVLLDGEVVLTALAPEQGDFRGNGPPPFDTPATGSLEIEIDLTNEGVYPEGSARAEFELSGPQTDFDVEVENIPAGAYPLFVGGIKQGDIEVVEDDDGETQGRIAFRFPPTGGGEFFDFDPRGQTIEIYEGATRLFFADFPDEQANGGDDEDDSPGHGQSPVTRTTVDLDNAGVFTEGEASAVLNNRPSHVEFIVELESVPMGIYALSVGGTERGMIDVEEDNDGDLRGRIRFRDPANPAFELLDFDPRGELIEIFDGGTLVFGGIFPE